MRSESPLLLLLSLLLTAHAHVECARAPLGPSPSNSSGWCFRVWAPNAGSAVVRGAWGDVSMTAQSGGEWLAWVADAAVGDLYSYVFSGRLLRADPCAQELVNATTSRIHDARYGWSDSAFVAVPMERAVMYEMHVGSFSGATLDGAAAALDYLAALGVTHVELMPVAAFDGPSGGWGYDPVAPAAVEAAFGGPGLCAVLHVSILTCAFSCAQGFCQRCASAWHRCGVGCGAEPHGSPVDPRAL